MSLLEKAHAAMAEFEKASAAVQQEIDTTRQGIENALQKREDIADAPVSRAEFADVLCEFIDAAAARFPRRLAGFRVFEQAFAATLWKAETPEMLAGWSDVIPRLLVGFPGERIGPNNSDLVAYLHRDRLKDLIRELVAAMPYPDDEAGLPLANRRAAVDVLDAEIEKLQQREIEMITSAQAAGMRLDDVVPRIR